MLRTLFAGIMGAAAIAGPAHAVQVCAWIGETIGEDDYHELKLWLEADGEADVLYNIKGEGLVNESSRGNAPNSGTLVLRRKTPNTPWTFGLTLEPPGRIDVIAELRAIPADIFSEVETPLLASFTFRRDIPEGETTPPKTFAAKQCATLGNPR
ncbi:hypothetical protein [Phenylobacterium sp.]|uniref:hypothetical protein n=1 Tax=Phenylobacterium sp. TaxID=1871053 RepID=UPI002ED9D8FE